MVTGNSVSHERKNLMTRRTVGVVQGKLFEIKEKMSTKPLFKDYIMSIFGESLYLQEQGHRLCVLTIVLLYFIIFHYRLLGNDRFHGIIAFNLLKINLLTHKVNRNINPNA